MITRFKKLLIIFVSSFIFLLSTSFCFAINLEVQYPNLPNSPAIGGSDVGIAQYFKYIFNFGTIIGFLAVFAGLVYAGVLYLISPVNPGLQAEAKDRVSSAISGLLILITVYLIITTINPALAFFHVDDLSSTPPGPAKEKAPGVYFHIASGCPDEGSPLTSNIADFGDKNNKIQSVNIIQDRKNQTSYVSVLYDTIDFSGKCQYIDPRCKTNSNATCTSFCTSVSFGNSASIYQYDSSPNGDGVFLYRKPGFDKDGGYYKVANSEIKGIYIKSLNDLCFSGESQNCNNPNACTVPKEEQKCEHNDAQGNCDKRVCPALSGENVSSIEIKGNYIVLLVYVGPKDTSAGPWTFCQAYPKSTDVSKNGPVQTKWDRIRNTSVFIPNYIIIIPVAQK